MRRSPRSIVLIIAVMLAGALAWFGAAPLAIAVTTAAKGWAVPIAPDLRARLAFWAHFPYQRRSSSRLANGMPGRLIIPLQGRGSGSAGKCRN